MQIYNRKILCGTLGAAIALGLSIFAAAAQAQSDPAAIALRFVEQKAPQFGLTGADVGEIRVRNVVPAGGTGVSHVYLQQRYRGIEVVYGVFTVNIRDDGSVINPVHRFVSDIASAAGNQSVGTAAVDAVAAAADYLGLKPSSAFEVLDRRGGPMQR